MFFKKSAVRCECHRYSKPVQSIQAIVDSAWSGAARWEQTAWAALAELFPWTAIFATWISLISIACSWFYTSKQVFHCWAWNFWLCRPNSFPTTFSPLKWVKYCLKWSAELKKWAPETLRAEWPGPCVSHRRLPCISMAAHSAALADSQRAASVRARRLCLVSRPAASLSGSCFLRPQASFLSVSQLQKSQ